MPRTEHDTFAKLITSIEEAENAARIIAVQRSDRRWTLIADKFASMKSVCFQIAMQGTRQ